MPAMLVLEPGNKLFIQVGGAKQLLDIEADAAITDISEDMQSLPGLLAWYHRCLAAAHVLLDEAEAGYRAWQGQELEKAVDGDPKIAEWKARAQVAALPAFLEWKDRQAQAGEVVARLAGAVAALEVKASMLQSLGAMLRTEAAHLEPSTRSATKRVDVEERGRELTQRLARKPDAE